MHVAQTRQDDTRDVTLEHGARGGMSYQLKIIYSSYLILFSLLVLYYGER